MPAAIGESAALYWRHPRDFGRRHRFQQRGDLGGDGHGRASPWRSELKYHLMVYSNHYKPRKLVQWGGSRSSRGVLTPKQLRAGRIFLGWTRAVLSKQSGVSIEAIRA